MSNPALLQTLASYVPPLIVRRLASDPTPIAAPRAERFEAAVFFVDISGFTLLTEKLGQRGPAGAEELTRIINTYFAQLIDLIHAHGGEIIKFAGDALLALWPVRAIADPRFASPLHEATYRATQCGLVVIEKLNHYLVMENWYLYLKVGLGAGQVLAVNVGGKFKRWEFLVTGAPLSQMTLAEKTAQRGEVTLAPEAWALIAPFSVGHILDNGVARVDLLNLTVDPAPAPPVLPPPPDAEEALLAFIPRAITLRLTAGQTDWLAELRRVTVLFLTIHGLDDDDLDQIQTVMFNMQEQLYTYEGSVRQFIVDDKGAVLIAALGLPPLAHEDDAARGVRAAMAMQEALGKLGLRGAVGITTGQAFCGEVGSSHRREYALVGGVVILSARLMQAASQQGLDEIAPILCDAATYHAAQSQFNFEALPAIMVKGKAEPVAVYRPILKTGTGTGPLGARAAGKVSGQIVGRTVERALIAEELAKLELGRTGGSIIIEGEAGIGKSRLGEHLRVEAEARHLAVLMGAGDAIESSKPYHAWRGVFTHLFDLNVLGEPEARRRHILDLFEDTEPGLLRLVPLLNEVLPLDFIDNELTVQMQGQVRADNTRDLLLQLLQNAATRSPKVIVLEDAHWLDKSSWALALALRQRTRAGPLLLVVITRPMLDAAPTEYRELLTFRGARHLLLDNLTPDETVILACQSLGVATLPEPVRNLLRERGEGQPSFSEELVFTLRDTGLLTINNGEAHLAPGAGDLSQLSFPDTVQGMITSRIDRLPVGAQFALKTASIIGRTFAFSTLRDIHPLEADRPNLRGFLVTLERLGLVALTLPDPELTYTFKHTITREVAYNLMLFSQRQKLHHAVAEWYETHHTADLAPFYQLLAHHWSKADDSSKALFYLELSGAQALRTGAYQEAINFFNEALKVAETQPSNGEMIPLREAAWERQMGEAYYGLGKLVESRDYLQRALQRLGYPLPLSTESLGFHLTAQAIRQMLHWVLPRSWWGKLPATQLALALEAARADLQLGLIATFYSEAPLAFFTGLRALNLAECGGPSPDLARVYAFMSSAATLITWHDLAHAYRHRAQAIAHDVNDLPAMAYVELISNQYTISFAQWDKARERYERALATCEAVGDQSNRGLGLISLMLVFYLQGQFERSAELAVELYASALERDHTQHKGWGLFGQGMSLLRLGKTDQALHRLDQALPLSLAISDNLTVTAIHGLRAIAYLRYGDFMQAERAAVESARILKSVPTASVYSAFDAYTGVAEVYLARWERAAATAAANLKYSQTEANWICRVLQQFARAHLFARPRALLYEGRRLHLLGRTPAALQAWKKSLAQARQLAMPYEEALAHFDLGRHGAPADQPAHLAQASEIFERLGATYDWERARAAAKQK